MVAAPQFTHTATLLPGHTEHEPASVAFAIQQVGADNQPKIRRGEDWKRSLRNQTNTVTDSLVNHRLQSFVSTAASLRQMGSNPSFLAPIKVMPIGNFQWPHPNTLG